MDAFFSSNCSQGVDLFGYVGLPRSNDDDSRIVRCKFRAVVIVITVTAKASYAALREVVIKNLNGTLGVNFRLAYCIMGGPKCLLRNDKDVTLMFHCQMMVRSEFVDIIVEIDVADFREDIADANISMQGFIEEVGPFDFGVRRPGRVLLSQAWRDYIVCINKKFDLGAEDFRDKLSKYAAEMGFAFQYKKNDRDRITAVCISSATEGCKWRVHASLSLSNGAFYIRTLHNSHTCGLIRKNNSSMLTAKVVSTLIMERVRADLEFRAKAIQEHVWELYGFEVSYWTAWNAREIARRDVLGDDLSSYKRLSRFVEMIKETNPGSYCVLEVNENTRRFERLFIAFATSIQGFVFCRPVLCFDGTFLKGKYTGTLLVACGKYANQGIYPLAFAVVSSETQVHWKWFAEHVAVILREQGRSITFMTDWNLGLLNAVKSTFPKAPLGFCMHHMKCNLQSKFAGSFNRKKRNLAMKLFVRCAYAPNEACFRQNFEELLAIDKQMVQSFLKDAPFSNWANAFFNGFRYGDMCSNVAESFNSWIRRERLMPITEMVDGIWVKMIRNIAKRNDDAAKWSSNLCLEIEKNLIDNAHFGRHFGIVKASDAEYEADDRGKVTMNVVEGTCSCGMWRINSFPCPQTAAVFKCAGLDAYKHIESYFRVTTFRACYSFPIHPIPNVPDCVANDGDAGYVCPPETKRQAGKPKLKRLKPRALEVKKMKCSRCGKKEGHNRKTCNEPI